MFIHLARLSHETNDVVSFQKSLDLPVLLSTSAIFLHKMTLSNLCYNLQHCGLYTSPGKVKLNLCPHTYCNYYCGPCRSARYMLKHAGMDLLFLCALADPEC